MQKQKAVGEHLDLYELPDAMVLVESMGGTIGTIGEETELRVAVTEPESRVPPTHVEMGSLLQLLPAVACCGLGMS